MDGPDEKYLVALKILKGCRRNPICAGTTTFPATSNPRYPEKSQIDSLVLQDVSAIRDAPSRQCGLVPRKLAFRGSHPSEFNRSAMLPRGVGR